MIRNSWLNFHKEIKDSCHHFTIHKEVSTSESSPKTLHELIVCDFFLPLFISLFIVSSFTLLKCLIFLFWAVAHILSPPSRAYSFLLCSECFLKDFVRYIFGNLFCKSKRDNSWNKEKCFLFHFERSFRSWDNQMLPFLVFKCYDVIKCLSMKHETNYTK